MISAARRPRPAGNLTSRREQSGRDLLQSNKKSLRRMDIPSKGESACFRGTTLIRRRLAAEASPASGSIPTAWHCNG